MYDGAARAIFDTLTLQTATTNDSQNAVALEATLDYQGERTTCKGAVEN